MHQHVHGSWDSMRFFLEVMWDSYNESTKEFDVRFHWTHDPIDNINNYWVPPYIIGDAIFRRTLHDGAIIPFRHQNPSPTSGSASVSPPLASAHLLYVRETITRVVAHMMGAAGYSEHEEWSDDDGDVSVLEFELG